jgi:rhodanese-related sulfurtransferase
MAGTVMNITTSDLAARLERGDEFLLVNALPTENFEEEHIPGSVSIPNGSRRFVEEVGERVGNRDTPVVVYCTSRDCQASMKAARKLADAGYTSVMHYADGITGWKRAGYDVESEQASRPRR